MKDFMKETLENLQRNIEEADRKGEEYGDILVSPRVQEGKKRDGHEPRFAFEGTRRVPRDLFVDGRFDIRKMSCKIYPFGTVPCLRMCRLQLC
jgi:hypothetical protein